MYPQKQGLEQGLEREKMPVPAFKSNYNVVEEEGVLLVLAKTKRYITSRSQVELLGIEVKRALRMRNEC